MPSWQELEERSWWSYNGICGGLRGAEVRSQRRRLSTASRGGTSVKISGR